MGRGERGCCPQRTPPRGQHSAPETPRYTGKLAMGPGSVTGLLKEFVLLDEGVGRRWRNEI